MICVIVTAFGSDKFYPIKETENSVSFLPIAVGKTLLTNAVSVFNTYFSRDKIYIVCSISQYEFVLKANTGISEENILVEPESINYSVSIYYASMILGKIITDEAVLFFRADRFFKPGAKISEWISACETVSSAKKNIFPLMLVDKENDEKKNSSVIVEAGKITVTDRKIEFYDIDKINKPENSIKRRKIFGKQGKMLYIVSGTISSLNEAFLSYGNSFFNELQSVLSASKLKWSDIIDLYKRKSVDVNSVSLFDDEKNKLCLFIDSFSEQISVWNDLKTLVSNGSNFVTGNVETKDCNECVILNFDDNPVLVENQKGFLMIKKDENVYCNVLKNA